MVESKTEYTDLWNNNPVKESEVSEADSDQEGEEIKVNGLQLISMEMIEKQHSIKKAEDSIQFYSANEKSCTETAYISKARMQEF